MSLQSNLETIRGNIEEACTRSSRDPESVHIIAVTKYVTNERAEEAVDAGITMLGENRLEGLQEKHGAIGDRAEWHFIGSLQSRKVKDMIDTVTAVHSLDRRSLAKEIQKRAPEGAVINCFVQVNVSGESTKSGLAPEETVEFIRSLADFDKINVIGLMTMAPYEEDPETVRPYFRRLRELGEEVQQAGLPHAPCLELSMGMSNDYMTAVEEGATYIRIGSSLVGSDASETEGAEKA
ncbi:YggS family pyridoxal phosphate-dependent enzyme [Alkalicoccus chagannorensis]|uniref:YggS family pyridoxal phosphate-dependent enzyme n=1 Tax=Alkalicoccus chagannorensis TaxID=427072 RepID=UPI00047EBD48|nr:YggS family pyridoxal phosphate-dependent enzyme [Alkalicoccus chagannorensis]